MQRQPRPLAGRHLWRAARRCDAAVALWRSTLLRDERTAGALVAAAMGSACGLRAAGTGALGWAGAARGRWAATAPPLARRPHSFVARLRAARRWYPSHALPARAASPWVPEPVPPKIRAFGRRRPAHLLLLFSSPLCPPPPLHHRHHHHRRHHVLPAPSPLLVTVTPTCCPTD